MHEDQLQTILELVKVPFEHPYFYQRLYSLLSKRKKNKENETGIISVTEDFEELSRHADRSLIQESCSIRNILRTKNLAHFLIDQQGDLNQEHLKNVIRYLKERLYSLGPGRQADAVRQKHILHVLEQLEKEPFLWRLIKNISRPINNEWAEMLIRHTLHIDSKTPLSDASVQRAVLSAWLCYLRQNVGSCFATAPSEIVHDEQGELFLQDISDLISKGVLKRIQHGVEHSVPLSKSWGCGDLKKPIVFYKKGGEIFPEVWYSPGLIAALEGIFILRSSDPLKLKIAQVKSWILSLIRFEGSQVYVYSTVEELLRKIIMHVKGVSEKQLKEWHMRPKEMFPVQLVVLQASTKKTSERHLNRVQEALSSFEHAKTIFKSYADNALLKAWEFTIASFTESKYEFTNWNLYSSLGLQSNTPGGIGECIQQTIQQKLDVANAKVESFQREIEMVYVQVKTLESRMRTATTDKEMSWYRVDYQAKRNEFEFLEEQKEKAHSEAQALVNLYETLYKLYVDLFKDYFQEVYDAEMQEVVADPFDDSPAGFRLLYKHGRSNTSSWTFIQNETDYSDALVSFFMATESQIANALSTAKIEKDLSDVVSEVIRHVRSREFLETAFHRMAEIHGVSKVKNPLENMERIVKKPWVYTSGGRMDTLVSSYFCLRSDISESNKWIESETELLIFLVDVMKSISNQELKGFFEGKKTSLLMQSPTHAFLLKPLYSPFKEMWMNESFTYTFVRDQFILPSEMFVQQILLDDEMIQYLLEKLFEKIGDNFIPRLKTVTKSIKGPLSPIFFREQLVDIISSDRILKSFPILSEVEIDAILYRELPLFRSEELKFRIEKILSSVQGITPKQLSDAMGIFERSYKPKRAILGAHQLLESCKSLLLLTFKNSLMPFDFHMGVSEAAASLNYSMPKPLIFADTNWVKDLFAFVVNPGTCKLELWRLDYTGSNARPMTNWKMWVDGSNKKSIWGVFNKPSQYTYKLN